MLELPLGSLSEELTCMRSMKVGGDSVTISGKQRAANRGGLCKLLLKNQSLSCGDRIRTSVYPGYP